MMMNDVNEEVVRLRAYYIWEREGRPEGRGEDHWHAALRELEIETVVSNGTSEKFLNGTDGAESHPTSNAKAAGVPRKSRIGSIAAKAKSALDGAPTPEKPAQPKRKRAPKADKGSSKRSPQTP